MVISQKSKQGINGPGLINRGREFIRTRTWRMVMAAAHHLSRYDNVVWVVGDGRSGTTLTADLINYDRRLRYMFEPFHSQVCPLLSLTNPCPFLPPNDTDSPLAAFALRVFRGRLHHPRIHRQNPMRLFYRGLLIKDIFTHLCMKWVDVHFPRAKKILVIRHPCSVAISKERLKSWQWMEDPRVLLSHGDCFGDSLKEIDNVIRYANTYFERQVAIWCILHACVFNQLRKDRIHLVFHERLCTHFADELRRLLSYVGDQRVSDPIDPRLIEIAATPSHTTRGGMIERIRQDPACVWREHLDRSQIRRANEIIGAFHLEGIYDLNGEPCREAAEELFQSR